MKTKFILSLFSTLLLVFVAVSADDKQREADAFFKKQMLQAHPKPLEDSEALPYKIPLVPMMDVFSNFLNVNTTPNETGQFKMQNESSIAINPKNKNNLIASAVDYRDTSATWVYVSQDAGKTWINTKLGRPFLGWTASNDPSVAFSNDGTGYLLVGGFGDRSNGSTQAQVAENGFFLARTTDEGNTWQSHMPVVVHRGTQTIDSTFEDKYYIWVDNSVNSPNQGHLYIPWKRVWAKDSATQIMITKSTDKGQTWSVPLAVSPRISGSSEDTTYGQSFPLAVTGPNGEVFVVWNNGLEHAVGFASSMDGGKTFSLPRLIQKYSIFGITTEIEPGVWRHAVKKKVRAESYPSLVCDITNGPRKGNLYLTWAADNIPNIYFSRSTDKGLTWSNPVTIHSDNKNDQLWQWIALDPSNGDIAVMYLDSRDDPENILTSTYVSYSSDGGVTWIDRRAANIAGDLRKNPFTNNAFAGDYSGCAFSDGKIYPSWIDMRWAELDIYDSDIFTAMVDVNLPVPPDNFNVVILPDKSDELKITWDKVKSLSFGKSVDIGLVKYILKRDSTEIAKLDGNITEYFDKGLERFKLYHYSISTEYGQKLSGSRIDSAWSGGSKEPGIPLLGYQFRISEIAILIYNIPQTRLDGITPFVNPKTLEVLRDDGYVIKIDITDNNQSVKVSDTVKIDGFYSYKARIIDSYDNAGPYSKDTIFYVGKKHLTYSDDFDEAALRRYKALPQWGITSSFSKSGNSLTDTPNEDYKPLTESSIILFPIEGDINEISVSFWHSAFVQGRDSALIDYAEGIPDKFRTIKYFDIDMYDPWKDKTKTADDWKFEQIIIPVQDSKQPHYIRFRLKTNATKNDDGWFIDNLRINGVSEVNQVLSENISVLTYPNPANENLNIALLNGSDKQISKIQIMDNLGQIVLSNYELITGLGQESINIKFLQSGFYNFSITLFDGKIYYGKFIKI
jgi:hypothetical protein